MQIEKHTNIATMNSSDIDCESILSKLILLTEQYKRLNELLENKQNMLKQRAFELQMRRLEHKCDMQKMWITLTQTNTSSAVDVPSMMLMGQTTAIKTDNK